MNKIVEVRILSTAPEIRYKVIMDRGFVDIVCPDCKQRLLHYHSRLFGCDVVRCPQKACGFQEDADTLLDVVGMKWQKAEENYQNERIRSKIHAVHIKLDSITADVGGSAGKKALLDAIFKFHPDRNPNGLDANEVLMVLNKLKGML